MTKLDAINKGEGLEISLSALDIKKLFQGKKVGRKYENESGKGLVSIVVVPQ